MKKLATILLSLTLVSSLAAKTLVGQIDIQRVLLTVAEGKKVRNQLKASFDKKQGELRSEEEKIKKLQSDFSKQSKVLSDKAKAKKEQEMQSMAGISVRHHQDFLLGGRRVNMNRHDAYSNRRIRRNRLLDKKLDKKRIRGPCM